MQQSIPSPLDELAGKATITIEQTAKLLIELGVSKFVPATPKDYEGNEKLLKAYLGY